MKAADSVIYGAIRACALAWLCVCDFSIHYRLEYFNAMSHLKKYLTTFSAVRCSRVRNTVSTELLRIASSEKNKII